MSQFEKGNVEELQSVTLLIESSPSSAAGVEFEEIFSRFGYETVRNESKIPPPSRVMTVFWLMAGTITVTLGTIFFKSFFDKLGSEAGGAFADGLKAAFNKSKLETVRYVNLSDLENLQRSSDNVPLDYSKSPPCVEFRISISERQDGTSLIFKFPSTLSEDEFIQAIRDLGEDYPGTIRRLMDENSLLGEKFRRKQIIAIYEVKSRSWIGGNEYVRLLAASSRQGRD